VAPVKNYGPILVDTSIGSFGEMARAVSLSMIRAHRHAEFDPILFEEMRKDAERTRGEEIDLLYSVNYMDLAPTRKPVRDYDEELKRAAELRDKSAFSWRLKVRKNRAKYYLHAYDGADALQLIADADTAYLAPEEIEAFLWSTEGVLAAAASDDCLDTTR
jgi:hypothetical protein